MYATCAGCSPPVGAGGPARRTSTFRVACGRLDPRPHGGSRRFRKHLFTQGRAGGGPVLPGSSRVRVRGAGAAWAWWPATGAEDSQRARRRRRAGAEAGLRKLAAQVMAGRPYGRRRRRGGKAGAAGHRTCCWAGTWCLRGRTARSRAGRVLACLQDLEAEREAAEAAAREQGQTYLQALEADAANGRPPAAVALAAQQLRVDRLVAAQQAAIGAWQAAARPAPGRGSAAARRTRRTPPGSAGPAPGWRTCRHKPPRKRRRRPLPAGTRRASSRSATSPTRTPG